MSRFSNRILLTLLLGLFFAAPEAVRSQGFDAKTLQRAQRNGQTVNARLKGKSLQIPLRGLKAP